MLFALLITLFITPTAAGSQAETARDDTLAAALRAIDAFLLDEKWREAEAFVSGAIGTPEVRARVTGYVRCRRLYDRFRRGRTRPALRTEIGHQTETAYRDLLATGRDDALGVRCRYQLGKFYQDRARWRLDFNHVLYAVEIDADLNRSSTLFRKVVNLAPEKLEDGLEWARSLADVNDRINLYLRARLLAPNDVRKAAVLNLAFDRLFQYFEANPGRLSARRAYLYAGLCQELGGAPEIARGMFLDLVPLVKEAWDRRTSPTFSEAAYHFCRVDRRLRRAERHRKPQKGATPLGRRRASLLGTLLRRTLAAQSQPPGRHAILAFGEIGLARLEDPAIDEQSATARFERDAGWLVRAAGESARALLAPYANDFVAAAGSFAIERAPLIALLAARGLHQDLKHAAGLDRAIAIARLASLDPSIRHRAWRTAARCWEGLGFLREAARALEAADQLYRGQRATHRYAANLWRRIARVSQNTLDKARYRAARDRLPRSPGEHEHRAGMAHFRRGALIEARRWLQRVPSTSRYYPLSLAYATYIRYLQLDATGETTKAEWEALLPALHALDRIPAGAPNLLPALALARLTEALVLRRIGRQPAALATLERFEDRFTPQGELVAEALKFRIVLQLERNAFNSAEQTLAELEDRFPAHRSYGEASLLMGRHLSRAVRTESRRPTRRPGAGRADDPQLRRSVQLRRRARSVLRAAFPARDRFLLGVDEMTLENWGRALDLLEDLSRKTPPELADRRPAIDARRARCLMAMNRLQEARDIVDELVRQRPAHVGPLRLKATLLGGTVERTSRGLLVAKRYLGNHRKANEIWQRLLEHASREVPYGPLWFEAQFHRVLMRYWLGRADYARSLINIIRVDYPEFGGEPYVSMLQWIETQLGR